jgi:hypothetical protein
MAGVGCLVFAAACAQTGPGGGSTGSGGQSSGSGGDNSSSGGTTGSGGDNSSSSGGSSASGGNTGTGGVILTGQGGSTASGGTTGAGGATASGGTTGTGGAKGGTTGSGGGAAGATGAGGTTPASGGTTGAGGTASGGTTGTGGAKGGTTGSGGAAGAPGSGGAGGISASSIVPGLMNLYWEGTCVGTRDPGGHNCPLDDNGSNCPTNSDPTKQGTVRSKTIPVMGTANQAYTVNIEVIGVIGTRCYSGGKRQSTAAIMTDGYNNSWYIGGSPSNSTDWWNSYELHVSPSTGDASGDVYYFNAFDNSGGSYCDSEATYLVTYPASFKVLGGGSIKLVLHDYNCQAQQNCGSNTDGTSTCMPRTVNFGSYSNVAMNSFMAGTQTKTGAITQPPTNQLTKTYNPQWLMIEVTSVTSP